MWCLDIAYKEHVVLVIFVYGNCADVQGTYGASFFHGGLFLGRRTRNRPNKNPSGLGNLRPNFILIKGTVAPV
jgi:hypothetical protein